MPAHRRSPVDDAALVGAWSDAVRRRDRSFTIPGHKGRGAQLGPALGQLLAGDVALFGGLASIKAAATVLRDAEAEGARLWQADWCRYSTGGSTHANQVLALAVGRPGDRVLVSRAAHRSTLSGLVLAGLQPVWLPTAIDARFGIPAGLAPETVADALDEHPDVVAVLCVEPSYLGAVSDVAALAAVAHDRGVPVVVDQAWGAHFGFHPAYPPHALHAGADAMILSAHKTLPAYSQASVVAARTERLDAGRLDRAFEVSATTSASGTILASIDASRALLAGPTAHELLGRLADVVAAARDRIAHTAELAAVRTPGPDDFATGGFDPAKLVLLLADAGLSGTVLETALIAAGMPVELADQDTLVPIVTMLDDAAAVDALVDALVAAAVGQPAGSPRTHAVAAAWAQQVPPAVLTPRDAFFAASETVAARAAVGRVAAELVAPYPPGVPVLVPGELVTADALDLLLAAAAAGSRIAYAADPTLATLRVIS